MKQILVFLVVVNFLAPALAQNRPNIVLVVADNVGWGELGTYGGGILRGAETPRLDSLADEGMKLLNFNAETLCTPSRSALMTGRHPIRSGTTKVSWGQTYGLVGWEKTIAELLSEKGYATGMFGKWHLGEVRGRFPTDQGFDEWYGIPNTSDEAMYSSQLGYDSELAEPPAIVEARRDETPRVVKPYDLEARKEIDSEITERAINFMKDQVKAKTPFFAYVPYTQAHLPNTPHSDFVGKTGNGTWADMLAEMDFRAGEILDAIDDLEIRDNTVVVWMSENGPEGVPTYFGTAGYWTEGVFSANEGNIRTPFLMRWPGKIKPGSVTNEIVHITDLLPTLAEMAGYRVPGDRYIDGVNQTSLLTGKSKKSDREGFPIFNGEKLHAYKWRQYKVKFMKSQGIFDAPIPLGFPEVFNLLRDPKEQFGISGGMGETGLEHLTWVLPVVSSRIFEFYKTFDEEPPIPLGTPEPYIPTH